MIKEDSSSELKEIHQRLVNRLVLAIETNDIKTAQAMIDVGANVNGIDDKGMTPLHKAAAKGLIQAGEFLLGKGADINATVKVEDTSWNALRHALKNRKYGFVQMLLENNAEIDAPDLSETVAILKRGGLLRETNHSSTMSR